MKSYHEKIKRYLTGIIERGAVVHAYLFIEPPYSAHESLAEWFLSAIAPSETFELGMSVDEARGVISAVGKSTFDGGLRVVFCGAVDQLTHEAGNCLLKCIEEPPSHTVFILRTHNTHRVLPTIVSRCHRIRMPAGDDTLYDAYELFLQNLHAPLWKKLYSQEDVDKNTLPLEWYERCIHHFFSTRFAKAELHEIQEAVHIAERVRDMYRYPSLQTSRFMNDRIVIDTTV